MSLDYVKTFYYTWTLDHLLNYFPKIGTSFVGNVYDSRGYIKWL